MHEITRNRTQNYTKMTVLCMFVFLFVWVRVAEAAVLYFGAPAKEIGVERLVAIGVFVDSEGESVNAFEGEIAAPETVEIREIADGASFVNFWVERPRIEGSRIIFSGIAPGGFLGSRGLLFSFVAYPRALGAIDIGAGHIRMFLNAAEGTPVVSKVAPISLRVVKDSSLPEFSRFVDTEAPEPFVPEVLRDSSVFGGRWFVAFAAQDKGSGIDRYEVSEGGLPFRTAESPYLLERQRSGGTIIVKAIDRQGNERIAEVRGPGFGFRASDLLGWLFSALAIGVLYKLWMLRKREK